MRLSMLRPELIEQSSYADGLQDWITQKDTRNTSIIVDVDEAPIVRTSTQITHPSTPSDEPSIMKYTIYINP